MNVASLELCKALYEVSGWDDTEKNHYTPQKLIDGTPIPHREHIPAYDLGYLMRQLPAETTIRKHSWIEYESSDETTVNLVGKTTYFANYDQPLENRFKMYSYDADIPEDAAAKLCISLFEQGILKRQAEA